MTGVNCISRLPFFDLLAPSPVTAVEGENFTAAQLYHWFEMIGVIIQISQITNSQTRVHKKSAWRARMQTHLHTHVLHTRVPFISHTHTQRC